MDEIDAIAPERGESFDSRVTERVVSQLLTELDGVEDLQGVFVLGATNRPDIVDRALLRPGRLEKNIYVPTPDRSARRKIFSVHTSGVPIADDVDFDELADETDGYTGNDIEAIVREASMLAMDEAIASLDTDTVDDILAVADGITVTRAHLDRALDRATRSVSDDAQDFYDSLVDRLGGDTTGDIDDSMLGFQ